MQGVATVATLPCSTMVTGWAPKTGRLVVTSHPTGNGRLAKDYLSAQVTRVTWVTTVIIRGRAELG
jgi:hypothetical protein